MQWRRILPWLIMSGAAALVSLGIAHLGRASMKRPAWDQEPTVIDDGAFGTSDSVWVMRDAKGRVYCTDDAGTTPDVLLGTVLFEADHVHATVRVPLPFEGVRYLRESCVGTASYGAGNDMGEVPADIMPLAIRAARRHRYLIGIDTPWSVRPAQYQRTQWASVVYLLTSWGMLAVAIVALARLLVRAAGGIRGYCRVRAGRCPSCGYDRTGIDTTAVCPECGSAAAF